MILKEWRKFKGWAVIEFFLSDGRSTYLKELSRTLKISPRTAQIYLRLYEDGGLLEKEKTGNMLVYSLAANAITTELKKAYLLLKISPYIKVLLADNPQISSLTLYGSTAKGGYDRGSDIDLLAIATAKSLNLAGMGRLEKELGIEVKLEVTGAGEWRGLAMKRDKFYTSVINNSITLHGVLP